MSRTYLAHVTQVIAPIAALVGVLLGAWLNDHLARRAMVLGRRREFYEEMLSMLLGRLGAMENIAYAPDSPPPPDFDDERVSKHDARLALYASDDVRKLGRRCFQLMQRFWASYTMKAPVVVDEHGLFDYQFHLVRDVPKETADLQMRVAFGGIHDELRGAVEALGAQMRRELQT